MEQKNDGVKKILIVILTIIIILLVGILAYNLGVKKAVCYDANDNNSKETIETIVEHTYIESEYNYNSGEFEEYPIEIKLPKISIEKTVAKEINEKIVINGIRESFKHHESFISMTNEGLVDDYEGTITRYDYEIKNDVIAIYIITIGKNGSEYPGSGTLERTVNYFYDMKNDKELTIVEALPLMGYTVNDLKEFNITKFSELTEGDSTADYKITNGKGEIIFHDCRQGCI